MLYNFLAQMKILRVSVLTLGAALVDGCRCASWNGVFLGGRFYEPDRAYAGFCRAFPGLVLALLRLHRVDQHTSSCGMES